MTAPASSPDQVVDLDLHASGKIHDLFAWMREHAPVHQHRERGLPTFWSLTRYHDVRAVYRDHEVFSSALGVLLRPVGIGDDPGGGLTLALTDPPRHSEFRSMITACFSERGIRALDGSIGQQVRAVLADAIDAGECDFAQDVATRLAIHGVAQLLGVPAGDREQLLRWTIEAFAAGRSLVQHPQIMRLVLDVMSERLVDPLQDAMSMFVHGHVGGRQLTELEILLNCENLVGAAENAGLSMAAGMLAFMEHPDQWRRLREARSLIPSAVEEVLRWTSSATHSMRTVTRPIEFAGQPLAAGDRVVLWIPSANRDKTVFSDPHRFDIARRPNRHLALGAGVHICIGSTMARHQMRALLATLMDMAEHVEPSGPATPRRSLAVNGPVHLPVRITARR